MGREARVEISLEQDIERELVVDRTRARNAYAFWTSRHLANASRFDVLFHFAQNIIELAARNITLHLLIPLVIFPTVQPRREFRAFFKREMFDGSFNLG